MKSIYETASTYMNAQKIGAIALLFATNFIASCSPSQRQLLPSHFCAKAVTCLRQRAFPLRWPEIHRGAGAGQGENSLAAVRRSVAGQFPMIEVDVRQGVDGTLFTFHDRIFTSKNSNVPPALIGLEARSVTSAHIAKLCVPPFAGPENCAPFLDRLLFEVSGTRSLLSLDLKNGDSSLYKALVAAVAPHLDNVIIRCSTVEQLRYFRRALPSLMLLARASSAEDIELMFKEQPQVLQIDEELLDRSLRDRAHRQGAALLVKALDTHGDTPDHWRRLLDRGADIVLTDKPDEWCQQIGCAFSPTVPAIFFEFVRSGKEEDFARDGER